MADYEYYICKNCKKIASRDKKGNCRICGHEYKAEAPYTLFTKELSLTENPASITAMDAIDEPSIKRKSLSAAEWERVLKSFFAFIGLGLISAFFAYLCFAYARSGAYRRNTVRLIALFALLAAPAFILFAFINFLLAIFSSNRAKKAETAFRSFWEKSVFQTKMFSSGFEKSEVAVGRIFRSLPTPVQEGLDQTKLRKFIEALRERVTKENSYLEEKSKERFGTELKNLATSSDSLQFENLQEKQVDEHKSIIYADLLMVRECSRVENINNKSKSFASKVAATRLHVATTLLKAGKYWYVADLMPKLDAKAAESEEFLYD